MTIDIQTLDSEIKGALGAINSAIQQNIRTTNLDPWPNGTNGSAVLGTIDLGICVTSAKANCTIINTSGLGTLNINSVVLVDPNAQRFEKTTKLTGVIAIIAATSSKISSKISGTVSGKCGYMNSIVDLDGQIDISGTQIRAGGTFFATFEAGRVCLNSVVINNVSVNFGTINIQTGKMGIFDFLKGELKDVITKLLQNQVKNKIARAIKPILDAQINKVLPKYGAA